LLDVTQRQIGTIRQGMSFGSTSQLAVRRKRGEMVASTLDRVRPHGTTAAQGDDRGGGQNERPPPEARAPSFLPSMFDVRSMPPRIAHEP
jgi:hypothetical protein